MSKGVRLSRETITRYSHILLVIIALALIAIVSYSFINKTEHSREWGGPLVIVLSVLGIIFAALLIWVLMPRDMRDMKKMMKEMEQRARLLDIVNTAATILLSGNERFSFEKVLLKSFELVGHCLDADRVQIWRNELIDEEMHFVLRHEWLSEFGKTRKDIPYGLHFPYSMKKEWEKLFLQGENINSPVSKLPDEDREFLEYYDMKSIVIIPMFLIGEFWGFFSIDDCRNERTLCHEEISILTSAGLMMCTAVNRNIQNIKMREADERMQIMIDTAPFCAIFWDKNLNLIDCNQEAVKMFGLSDKQEYMEKYDELSPQRQSDGSLSGEKGLALVGKALDEGYCKFEWMHQKLNGELIPSEITCVRVKHKEEFIVIEYIRDLREQQAMIAEMRKAEIAEESSKAKSDFLARMSHEIRTPMNAILGIAEIQLQDESLPQTTKEGLERIYNSGDLLLGIINDILDLSKIEAGKLSLISNQYDIASLIHDTVQLLIMRYESKPIEFKLIVDEKTPVMFVGDELRIKQILNNLLSNAFKYTDEGTVSLYVYAEDEAQDENSVTLMFRIKDTGQGMTVDQVSKLGSEYSRFNLEANRKTEGTGLGMNITRNLIRLMNGDIFIESTLGVGTEFTVRLPQKCIDKEPIGKELADNLMQLNHANSVKIRTVQIKREFMPYGRVLIVDDVETNLYVAKGLMAPYGLSIDTAMSGFETIDKIRDGNIYDIIFMDHMMPKMDGIEAAKIVRSLGYKKPIVALTANALAGQAEMFLNCGFDDFISKPVDIRQLNITLNKLIRDKMPPDVVKAARMQKESLYGIRHQSSIDSQIAEFFVRDAKKTLKVLEAIYINKCRSDEDISMFVINIHAMKSALANVGENSLSVQASKLEQAGRDKNIKVILSELPAFMELLFGAIEKFESKNKDANGANKGDVSLLKEKLQEIKSACTSYDKKTAKDLLAEIRKKAWPSKTEEILGEIASHLLHSEFDEAVKVIEEFK
ncbi:MAG: ATP-binding protein [Treponema sp.]|nr:ATP-binding protein [Treponema sp.]